MYQLLLVLSLLSGAPKVFLEFAEGDPQQVPADWIAYDNIDKLSIGKSYWVKVSFRLDEKQQLTLQGGNWYMQNIQFHNEQHELISIGNSYNVLDTSGNQTYYLFYPFHDEKETNHFKISLIPQEVFLREKYAKNVFQSAFNAILVFVLLVCIFFIFGSSSRIYVNYILYITSILVFFSYQYGLLGGILPFVNRIPPTWMWILSASISFTYVLFSRSFLDMKDKDHFNYKVTTIGLYFILLIVATEAIARIFHYDILHAIWYKTIILFIEFCLMVVFVYRIATMKTLISSIFLIGAFILLLSSLTGQIASTFKIAYETNRFVQIGLLMDVFVLSIGIAIRVNLIQKERRNAQQRLIEQLTLNEGLQKEYLVKLEKEVAQRTADLDKRNVENETLLKEVHHRVKNNLQMITSLLNMQQRRLKENAAKEALILTKNRVKSIGLIHEHLYTHNDFSKINLVDYVEELTAILIESLNRNTTIIHTELQVEHLKLDIETAIPIGLILNELITNSIKYAFTDHSQPKLSIHMKVRDNSLLMDVIDNGLGIKSDSAATGFGNTIIQALIENLNGTLEYPEMKKGFHVRATLRKFHYN